ncbi:MAG: hypothetical protein JJT96_18485 [Opitutales bacterium]|nr:hypothetical protein [Opitutales bacterium]
MKRTIKTFFAVIIIFHIFSSNTANALRKQGLSFNSQIESIFLQIPSVEPDGIWIKIAASFLLDGYQFIYAEVSISGSDLLMGSWTGPIIIRAPIADLDWAEAEFFALKERIIDVNELRNPRKERIDVLIESGRRIFLGEKSEL